MSSLDHLDHTFGIRTHWKRWKFPTLTPQHLWGLRLTRCLPFLCVMLFLRCKSIPGGLRAHLLAFAIKVPELKPSVVKAWGNGFVHKRNPKNWWSGEAPAGRQRCEHPWFTTALGLPSQLGWPTVMTSWTPPFFDGDSTYLWQNWGCLRGDLFTWDLYQAPKWTPELWLTWLEQITGGCRGRGDHLSFAMFVGWNIHVIDHGDCTFFLPIIDRWTSFAFILYFVLPGLTDHAMSAMQLQLYMFVNQIGITGNINQLPLLLDQQFLWLTLHVYVGYSLWAYDYWSLWSTLYVLAFCGLIRMIIDACCCKGVITDWIWLTIPRILGQSFTHHGSPIAIIKAPLRLVITNG